MTKRRTTKRTKAKSRKPARKVKPRLPVAVQRVVLPPDGIVCVAVPPGAMPVVATDPVTGEIVIAPAKKKTWLETLFG